MADENLCLKGQKREQQKKKKKKKKKKEEEEEEEEEEKTASRLSQSWSIVLVIPGSWKV